MGDEAIWLEVLQEVGVVLSHHGLAEGNILDEFLDGGDTAVGILIGEVVGAIGERARDGEGEFFGDDGFGESDVFAHFPTDGVVKSFTGDADGVFFEQLEVGAFGGLIGMRGEGVGEVALGEGGVTEATGEGVAEGVAKGADAGGAGFVDGVVVAGLLRGDVGGILGIPSASQEEDFGFLVEVGRG
jgi:hypothetical protein